jgi:hypothetical protein
LTIFIKIECSIYKIFIYRYIRAKEKEMNIDMNKVCKEGKVVNPSTGRCINKETLDKKMNKANAANAAKAPFNKVIEPYNKRLIDNLKILAI